jgi:hypothetical protein
LFDILNRQPYVLVPDGLERLLLAYARPDAARLADDDLDELTANVAAGALGLSASASTSFTGQVRLRLTADPRAGAFLKRLASVQAARVLVTSRLYPAELQTVTMEPVPGAFAYFLRGLAPNDAVQLWRGLGGSGSRAELVELFAAFDNYPLLIRALAGEVARFRRAPGDLAAWRQANPKFDPFRLPLVQRKSHVLEYALSGLTAADMLSLNTIAAFRAPTSYDILATLLVGHDQPGMTEAGLDRALADLLSEALATARSTGLAEDEVIARIELTGWHLRSRRILEAREHIRDAIELAERSQLRLRLADALNMLSQVEQGAGDTAAAIDAARAAFRQAWCDGPPFSYAAALTNARAHLAALGEPEPTGLPSRHPERPVARVAIRPAPPVAGSAASWRAYGWPRSRCPQSDVLAEIQRVGWISADHAVVAELAARVADPDGGEMRARLLMPEIFEPTVRVELATWIFRGGHPEAEPVLRELLGCPDAKVRTRAVAELSRSLNRADRRLLTTKLNGTHPFLDPTQPITEKWMEKAAQRTGESVDQVRRRYERLAEPFRLQLPAATEPDGL